MGYVALAIITSYPSNTSGIIGLLKAPPKYIYGKLK